MGPAWRDPFAAGAISVGACENACRPGFGPPAAAQPLCMQTPHLTAGSVGPLNQGSKVCHSSLPCTSTTRGDVGCEACAGNYRGVEWDQQRHYGRPSLAVTYQHVPSCPKAMLCACQMRAPCRSTRWGAWWYSITFIAVMNHIAMHLFRYVLLHKRTPLGKAADARRCIARAACWSACCGVAAGGPAATCTAGCTCLALYGELSRWQGGLGCQHYSAQHREPRRRLHRRNLVSLMPLLLLLLLLLPLLLLPVAAAIVA